MNQENTPPENLDNLVGKPEQPPDLAPVEIPGSFLPPPGEVNKEMMNQEIEEVKAKQETAVRQKLEELYDKGLEAPRKPGFTPEESGQEYPAGKSFSQRAKEAAERFSRGAKRGAKAAAETWKAEKTARKAKKAEAKKAEEKEIRQQAETIKSARAEEKKREAEKAQKEAEAKADAKQKEKEKREAAREAEKIEQERKKSAGGKRTESRGEKQPAQSSPSENIKAGKEKEAEAVEERDPNPWENWKEQSRMSEEYFSAIRLSPESKKYINESLQGEIKDIKAGLATKWFEENKYKLEAKGIPINGLSREAMISLAVDPITGNFSKEILDYFEKNKDLYEADLLKIDNAEALGSEFEKNKIPMESQFLMLNHLEKRTSDLYGRINKLESLGGKENRDEAVALQKEIDNLFIARKELAEKATGRDLTKETLARVAEKLGYGSKEEYIKDKMLISQAELMVRVEKMNSLAENEFNELSLKEKKRYEGINDFVEKWQAKGQKLGLSQDQLYALSFAGYKTNGTRKTGFLFFGRGMELIKTDGVKVKIDRKEFYKNIVEQAEYGYKAWINASARKELGRRWDQEETGAIIGELAITMKESVGGTKAAYERLKQNLAEEYRKNIIREKTAQEQAKQDKEFGKERKKTVDILGFLSDALKGEAKFAELTGDLKKDKKILRSISEDYGIGISPGAFKGLDADLYSKTAKNRGGLISLFIELMIKNPYKKFTKAAV